MPRCGQTPPPCCPVRLVLCLFFPKLFRRTRILIKPPLIVVFQPQLLPICPPCQIQPIRHCYQMRGIIQLMTLLTNFTQRWIFNLLLVIKLICLSFQILIVFPVSAPQRIEEGQEVWLEHLLPVLTETDPGVQGGVRYHRQRQGRNHHRP